MTNKASKKHQVSPDDFEVEINPEEPLFAISVVSRMVEIPIWTLRKLDDFGIICPERIGKKTRCYSKVQIKKLSYVHYLMEEKHITISNVKVFLEITGNKE
ncbi:MAG: MerR family transcriptional regulator [Candidatus Omnitrophota bacterium]